MPPSPPCFPPSAETIWAAVAALLPEPLRRAALRRLSPITVVMPDLQGQVPYPDVAARMKRQLGIEG